MRRVDAGAEELGMTIAAALRAFAIRNPGFDLTCRATAEALARIAGIAARVSAEPGAEDEAIEGAERAMRRGFLGGSHLDFLGMTARS